MSLQLFFTGEPREGHLDAERSPRGCSPLWGHREQGCEEALLRGSTCDRMAGRVPGTEHGACRTVSVRQGRTPFAAEKAEGAVQAAEDIARAKAGWGERRRAGHTADDVEGGTCRRRCRRDPGKCVGQCPHVDSANAYRAPTTWHALGTSNEHARRVPARVVNVLPGVLADQPPESPRRLI